MGDTADLFGEGVAADTERRAKKRRHDAVVFKSEGKGQIFLLPPSLDECLGPVHIARFINEVVDRIDLGDILARYKGGGTSSFHPGTLLKIWPLGWTRGILTSRPLAAALHRDIEFMWIAGTQKPSHMTLNVFRRQLGEDIKTIFKATVRTAMEAGIVDGSEIFVDHTKEEADANRYKVTWKKNIERWLEKVNADLDVFLAKVDELNDEEDQRFAKDGDREAALAAISPELIAGIAARINEEMKSGTKDRETAVEEKALLRDGLKKIERKEKYEETLERLGERNSKSNTDEDASAMMMKDKVSVRPGYNVGIAAQNGIVTGYDVSDNANDSVSFNAVLADSNENIGKKPDRVCADAGYGTHENYQTLEEATIEGYVKYPGWLRDEKGKRSPYEAESFIYNEEADSYTCAGGALLHFVEITQRKNKRTGFIEELRKYGANESDCSRCPHKNTCTKASARTIQINPKLKALRKKARERLQTEEGLRLRSRRAIEVETVFGDQKRNRGFHRLHLRGMTGAHIECGLCYASWNLRKLYKHLVAWITSQNSPAPLPIPG